MWPWLQRRLRRTARAVILFALHAVAAGLVISVIKGVDLLLDWLYGTKGKVLVGAVPLSSIFEAADLAILVAFGVAGVIEMVKELFFTREDED